MLCLTLGFQIMENLPNHTVVQVTQEEFMCTRNSLNLNKEQIDKSIDDIEEWWKKQDHLVDALPYIDRGVIERYLLISKGSVETCKKKIDNILTTRGLFSDLILKRSPEEFEHLIRNVYYLLLPKINKKDNSRVTIIAAPENNSQEFNFANLVRLCFMVSEVRIFLEYTFADRYIIDLKNVTLQMVAKFNPFLLKKGEILGTKVYGLQVKGIHIINAPSFIDKIVNLLKTVLSEKLVSRIFVHKSHEELHQEICRDVLPQDYGGHSLSINSLIEQWKKYFETEEAKKVMDNLNKMVSDESRRTSVKFNEEYLGMPGSFRQLNVD